MSQKARFALRALASLLLPLTVAACSDSGSQDAASLPDSGAGDGAIVDGAIGDGGMSDAGANDGSTSDGGIDPVAILESACRGIHGRICAGFTSCNCRLDVRGLDPATCADERTATCVANIRDRIAPDLAAGRVRVDTALADRCFAALDAVIAECRTARPDPLPFECAQLFVATATIGASCAVQGGGLLYCSNGEGLCTPGREGSTCTRLPTNGQPCLGGDFCANGTVCTNGTCTTPGADGAPCTDVRGCRAGLVCNGSTMTCRAPGTARAVCAGADDCDAGLVCTNGTCAPAPNLGDPCTSPIQCGSARTCGRAPETRTCGDALGAGDTCEPGTCGASLLCDARTMSCTALPGIDEPCLNGTECAPGLACEDGTAVCRPLPGEGETCFVGAKFCAPGLGCDQTMNRCVRPGGDGAECLLNPPDYLCAEGFGCSFEPNGSICRPLAATGGTCSNDRSCAATDYCDFGALVCRTKLGRGGACPNGNECGPNLVCTQVGSDATCQPVPARDEPCVDVCASPLVCKGPGGQCTPELCVIP